MFYLDSMVQTTMSLQQSRCQVQMLPIAWSLQFSNVPPI